MERGNKLQYVHLEYKRARKYASVAQGLEDCRCPNGGYAVRVAVTRKGHAATRISLENTMLSERSQAQKIPYYMILSFLICKMGAIKRHPYRQLVVRSH